MSIDVNNWTSNQVRFIAWLALPKEERKPHTQLEFANQIGVREETLSRWKRDEELTEAAATLAKAQLTGHIPDIYGALIRKAKAGSFFHIKLCLEVAGHYVEKKVVGGDADNPIRHEHDHEHKVDLSKLSEAELDGYENLVTKLADTTRARALPNPN